MSASGIGRPQALDAKGPGPVAREGPLDLVRHFGIGPRRRQLAVQRAILQLQPQDSGAAVHGKCVRAPFQEEIVAVDHPPGPAAGQRDGRVGHQPADIVAGVEPLDGVGGHPLHTPFAEGIGELAGQSRQDLDLTFQDHLVQLAVAEPAEHGARPGAGVAQGLRGRRDTGLPGAPRAVGQHEDLRPLPFEPAIDAELVAGMRDHQDNSGKFRHRGESLMEDPRAGSFAGDPGEGRGGSRLALTRLDQAPMPSTAGLNMNMRSRMLCGASVMPQPIVRASFSGR